MRSTLSVREELRTYSKGDLTRIAVLATQKQAAAEAELKAANEARWSIIVIAFLLGGLIGLVAGWLLL